MLERALSADVAIVGGGVAGIAALASLRARGVDAVLLESEAELGGKVRAVAKGGAVLPRGPLVWDERHASIARLLELLGLSDDVVPLPPSARARYVVRHGRLRPLEPPLRTLLATSAAILLDRVSPVAIAPATDAEELSAAACFPGLVGGEPGRLGRTLRALRAAATPQAVLPQLAPAGVAPGELAPSGLAGVRTLRGGLWRIGAAAAARWPVHLGVRVEAVDDTARGARVLARDHNGSLIVEAKAVLLATEAPVAAGLLPARLGLGSMLSQVQYAPIALVHWQEPPGGSKLPHGFGWRAPPREHCFALGTLFVSDILGDGSLGDGSLQDGGDDVRAPAAAASADDGGRRDRSPRRFATFVGGTLTPERALLSDAELGRVVGEEVRRLGGRMGPVLHVERWPLAVALAVHGFETRAAAIQARLTSTPFALAGSWLGRGAMVDAVESGFAAADDLLARLAQAATLAPAAPREPAAPAGLAVSSPVSLPVSLQVSLPGSSEPAEPAELRTRPPAGEAASPGTAAEASASRNGKRGTTPLFVVGASYREGPTDVRARLAALERGDDAPSKALVRAGYAEGVVVLETCSRVEWIVSSSRPQWAAELLKSTLSLRVPEARLHAKVGHAAAHYLLRLAMGLDSVAEGEPAVARQLVLAFETSHKEGRADRVLRLSWRGVQQLLGERRRRGVVQHGLGVQTLALEELAARGVTTNDEVLVFGQGEIGRAVLHALRESGHSRVEAHRRATHEAFLEAARRARAVVVCTGGPAAFLELPPRDADAPPGVVIDVGVPEQVKAAPGWTSVALEELLQRPRRLLDDDTRAWLVEQVAQAADRLSRDLADPPPTTTLGVIDEERRVFLRETLPPLLEKLPQQSAEEVRKAVAAFAHHLMERVREGGVS